MEIKKKTNPLIYQSVRALTTCIWKSLQYEKKKNIHIYLKLLSKSTFMKTKILFATKFIHIMLGKSI